MEKSVQFLEAGKKRLEGDTGELERVSTLIGDIYDAGLDPAL